MKLNNIKNNLILELHIPNFEKAKNFYSLFGFKEILNESSKMKDKGDYMVLKREDTMGSTMINFYGNNDQVSKHARFVDFPSDTPRGYAVEITIPVTDVEKLWKDIKSKIKLSQISQKLMLKRWGKKDFRVIDPFGFYVRFTELVNWRQ